MGIAERLAALSPEKLQKLADQLIAKGTANENLRPIVAPAHRPATVPLSYFQEGAWLLDRLGLVGAAYHEMAAIMLGPELNIPVLQRALNEIVRRHEILRTRIETTEEGIGVQVIDPADEVPMQVTDLSSLSRVECALGVGRLAHEDSQSMTDLAKDSLFRVRLVKITGGYVLCLTIHHILFDGWSLNILIYELTTLYASFLQGRPSPFPPPELQYADFAIWQRERLHEAAFNRELSYWRKQLAGVPPLSTLPSSRPRPAIPSHRGNFVLVQFPHSTLAELQQLGRREGATLFMLLLALLKVSIYRWSGQEDIAIGSPLAGRERRETEGLIGLFINTLVLRTSLGGQPTFREFLARVREVALGAYAHQEMPFEKLVAELKPERSLAYQPLFQVLLVLHNQHRFQTPSLAAEAGNAAPGPAMTFEASEISRKTAKFDLMLEFVEVPHGLFGRVEYATDLFDMRSMNWFKVTFSALVESVVSNPDQKITELAILNEAQRRHLLQEWNQSYSRVTGPKCLHEAFTLQAAKTPNAVAVEYDGRSLTYLQLEYRSNQLARYLRKLGVQAETLVGICVERGLQMLIGLLGILKAGGAYVPLDASYPKERLAHMLRDSGARVVLTQKSLLADLPEHDGETVIFERDWAKINRLSCKPLGASADPENPAYVIYTSGSTGIPKGVTIAHSALINFLRSVQQEPGITGSDVLLAVTTLSFDIAGLELYLPLVAGARVRILSREASADGQRLLHELERGVTFMQATPATWRLLLHAGWTGTPGLKILCGGEALDLELAKELVTRCDSAWNMYGPTETTIWSLVEKLELSSQRIAIGRPIWNTSAYVLDDYQQPVPEGATGELYLGGAGLARGYLNRPDLTAQQFVPDPFDTVGGRRLYRTGDLVRWRACGWKDHGGILSNRELEFVARRDSQVKVRGHRIELGEIEVALLGHPGIRECAVVARDVDHRKQLVAYLVGEDRSQSDFVTELRQFLLKKLPEYMVPSLFVFLPALPLTPNGKVDRKNLPAPDRLAATVQFVAPSTADEVTMAQIWEISLKRERVGIHDNFFSIGGDSIIAIQVVARGASAGIRFSVKDMFEHQTIAELLGALTAASPSTAAGNGSGAAASDAIFTNALAGLELVGQDAFITLEKVPVREPRAPEQGIVEGDTPWTPIQRKIQEQFPDAFHHNIMRIVLECEQRLVPEALEKALREVVMHHDALRLCLYRSGNTWEQWNAGTDDAAKWNLLEYADVSMLDSEEQDSAVQAVKDRTWSSVSDTTPPLVRAALVDCGTEKPQLLILGVHHLGCDATSLGIVYEDLLKTHDRILSGDGVALPPKTMSFRAWARRLKAYAASPEALQEAAYWNSFSAEDYLPLPVDYDAVPGERPALQEINVVLDQEKTALLGQVQQRYGVQMNEMLTALLMEALAAWSGNRRLCIELLHHGRIDRFDGVAVDLSRTVGWLAAEIPVYLDLTSASGLEESLKLTKEQFRAIPNEGISQGVLRYMCPFGTIPIPAPAIRLNHLGAFGANALGGGVSQKLDENERLVPLEHMMLHCAIDVTTGMAKGCLFLHWLYDSKTHSKATLEKVADNFLGLLEELTTSTLAV